MRGAAVEIWVGACFQNLDAFHPVAFCAVDQAFDAGEFALGLDEITPTLFVDAPRLLPRCFADLRTAGSGSPGHCNATRTLFSLRPAVRMVVGSRAGACVRACGTCGTCGTCVYVRMCVSRGGWAGWAGCHGDGAASTCTWRTKVPLAEVLSRTRNSPGVRARVCVCQDTANGNATRCVSSVDAAWAEAPSSRTKGHTRQCHSPSGRLRNNASACAFVTVPTNHWY